MAIVMKTGRSARLYHSQQVHYLYARFTGSDVNPTSTGKVVVGVLPAACLPLETYVRVNVGFSTGEILVGTSVAASSAALVSTDDVVSATTGLYVSDRFMGQLTTVDLPVYVQTKSSGQTAAGQVDVWVNYLPAAPNTTV
jgi:hypothetical protein